ncbi:hypothetical protein IFM89_031838 [Coptis chinensis]|uniref:Uncharacterized protein n=1 Tax=Coptis chinensis TaxID=261450 RepID=A0A835LCB0_9MAGN|nr:hypothetical protein IFM89_031838 [Coptis chinensis]
MRVPSSKLKPHAFLRVLPLPPNGLSFSDTWKQYEHNEDREGWYKDVGYEDMHLQGKRWGGRIREKVNLDKGTEYIGSIYDAETTFESYGVPHGSADLVKAVPAEHKKFLSELVWVHEENVCVETSEGKTNCRLIAVHAGLEKGKGVEEQLKILKAKDTSIPKVEALSGKASVWEIPKDWELLELEKALMAPNAITAILVELCEKPTIVVSGHHGKLHIDGLRLIIDEGGGKENNPVTAIVLPSMTLVRDTDSITTQL